MAQQKSLFSFYSRGAPGNAARRSAEFSLDSRESSQVTSNGGLSSQQNQASVAERRVNESLLQQNLLQRIQQKFVRKEHVEQKVVRKENVDQKGGESSLPAPGPRIPGFKRVREDEPSSSEDPAAAAAAPSEGVNNEKRLKLMEILGADDCSSKGGAWEAAKARFEWMAPDRIRDGKKRRPGDPLYDARTLHIPGDVFHKLSASQKQYWSTKCQYMDTILFFKVVTCSTKQTSIWPAVNDRIFLNKHSYRSDSFWLINIYFLEIFLPICRILRYAI